MANTTSAKKAMRQARKRELMNRSRKSRVHTFTRKAKEAIAQKAENVVDALRKAESELMRAAQKGIIHKKKASRKISRLQKAFQKSNVA